MNKRIQRVICTSLLHPPSNDGERMQPKFISNNHKYALKAQNYKSSHLLNKINNTIEQLKSLRAVCMSMSMIMTMMIIIGIKFHNATIKSMNRLLQLGNHSHCEENEINLCY
uniref:Uncharacterized protein n=1 Tax=Glossina palpalis gambiensis TaxID=67801 RepID=A0A1B0ARR4_9MUSC